MHHCDGNFKMLLEITFKIKLNFELLIYLFIYCGIIFRTIKKNMLVVV